MPASNAASKRKRPLESLVIGIFGTPVNPIFGTLVDPPRTGALDVLPALAKMAPRRLAYVSCHPGSLARDLGILVSGYGFTLQAAGIVDMFPHTSHVESVAILHGPKGS